MTTSHRGIQQNRLRRLLNPKHIVFVGGKTCIPAIEMARVAGFKGAIWVVHPSYDRLAGLPVFRSIADLPHSPDAAFLNIPKSATIDVVEQLKVADAGGAVCFAAGFAETGDDGRQLQRQLIKASGDLALVGPNSNGVLNYFDQLALWPTADHQPPKRDRGVAIISQSGGLLYNYTSNQRSVNAGYLIGVGNQAVLDMSAYVDVMLDDDRVNAIGLFMEDIGDVASFSEAACKAIQKQIPIVTLKTGHSEVGALVAQTHSGALVADDNFYDALFQRVGVIRVRSLPEFDETLKMLTATRRVKGRRVAILTNSGGEKALAADCAADTVLEFPQPSESATESLQKLIPAFASVSNPFDYNDYYPGSGPDVLSPDNPHLLVECFQTIIEDGYDVGVMLMGFRTSADDSLDEHSPTLDAWITANRNTDRAVVLASVMPEHLPKKHRELLLANGIAPLQGLTEAIAAIDCAVRWNEFVEKFDDREIGDTVLPNAPAVGKTTTLISEIESKSRLSKFGLKCPRAIRCPPQETASVITDLIYPVVVKSSLPVLAHKHQVGGVVLHVRNGDEVLAAVEEIEYRLQECGLRLEEVLIESMVENARLELFAGVKHDSRFGHALIFGLGGTDVESSSFVETLLLPSTAPRITRLVQESRHASRFSEIQCNEIAKALQAIAEYVSVHTDSVASIDVNPLILTSDDQLLAADALIEEVSNA